MPSVDLLNRLNSTPVEDLAQKENKKNAVADAHEQEKIRQSENRTKIGGFFVNWCIALVTAATCLLIIMTAYYAWGIMQEPEKLEKTLSTIYGELKYFVVKYQSVIAIIATLMFGDKIRDVGKSKK